MKRTTLLIIALLGYLTYIAKRTAIFTILPTPELLLQIILYGIAALIIAIKILRIKKEEIRIPKIKQIKRKTVKKQKVITPFDKQFKRNYKKTKNNYVHKEPIPDQKSAYIQSAWDELGKL